MTRFPSLSESAAPAETRPVLAASAQKFGFVPSPVARAAAVPALLQHMLAGFAAFDRTSLSRLEREVVAMTVAFENGCHYCMALHTAELTRAEHAGLAAELRAGQPLSSPRLEALRVFARSVLRDRGRVPAETWERFEAAGFTSSDALAVVLGVGAYALSTLANLVTGAELEPPLAAFAWVPPASDG